MTRSILVLAIITSALGCSTSRPAAPPGPATLDEVAGLRVVRSEKSCEILTLEFKGSTIDQRVIDLLGDTPATGVEFIECDIRPGIDLAPLSRIAALKHLRFEGLTLPALRNLDTLSAVRMLTFTRCESVGPLLPQVAKLRLNHLGLSGSDVTAHEFGALAGAAVLSIHMNSTGIGDEVVPVLQSMPKLKWVMAAYSRMTEDGAETMRMHGVDLEI